jgi:hypothetical protein
MQALSESFSLDKEDEILQRRSFLGALTGAS